MPENNGKCWTVWGDGKKALFLDLDEASAKKIVDDEESGLIYAVNEVTGEDYTGE